ncbi:S-adenosyl-L-methionine:benzoic acid/salicylic acid carboxyl methyltransferase 3-like isoform X1 [Magnolia sinica]|uniref:S-adenosyl-L-methionine:benzoic acid/salicylic acid carboxyl methyltransferase 3-like isoform X1 n=1 Tax=Magnolia sinica TaxID=86752 RepID=UPI00265A006F|nr:S-adenosyl-L-methionine:benzoic acid/salicylic acid carboxyl methyltransferase 3-like isoform X1 [Magnolia sinica]
MEVQQVLHMIGGAGETSYANNSTLQEIAISKVKSVVEKSIIDLYCTTFPKSLGIVDMGCSSGPNTFLAISNIMEAVDQKRCHLGRSSPEFRVFLNDLPGNDFNNIFKSLAGFHEKLKQNNGPDFGPCFIAGVPGSFYGRLFPTESLDFVHSSYSLHWLSQVPPGLENGRGGVLNKGNIYMAKTSPPAVFKAYLEQFERDFSLFLRSRSEEMTSGGCMVLTLMGRRSSDPSSGECCYLFELLSQALMEMVSQGIIKEAEVDSFNLPYYTPSVQELMTLIETDGSFHLDGHEVIELNWDPNDDDNNEDSAFDKLTRGRNVAKIIRAVTESLLANHFGEAIVDNLFKKYGENVANHLTKEKTKHVNLVLSMTKK